MAKSQRSSWRSTLAGAALAAIFGASLGITGWISPVTAQVADTATRAGGLEEILVTARKREERLQDVPEAITPVTAADIEHQDIVDLNKVALLTPSFTLNNYDGQKTRRDVQVLYVRGVKGTVEGVGTFINGAPAGSSSAVSLDDVDRVEVLKGPQAAYFGRATFAGGVNYVTRTPSETWRGYVDGEVGTYNRFDFKESIEGPAIPEVLTFRLSARQFSQDGQYRNAFDGTRLGDQSTKDFSVTLDYHKGDHLKVVLVTLGNELYDGMPMQVKFGDDPAAGFNDFNCNAGAAPAGQNNYMCGQLPRTPANRIGYSYFVNDQPGFPVREILFGNSLGFPNPSNVKPNIDCYCTRIYDLQSNLRADYTFSNGITVSWLEALSGEKSDQMINPYAEITSNEANPLFGVVAGATPTPATEDIVYAGWIYNLYDELRIAGDPNARLRWMAGASYYRPINRSYSVNYGVATAGKVFFGNAYATAFNNTYDKPIGLFGSLSYNITDKLTANLEAREQYDKMVVQQIEPLPSISIAESSSWKLEPRTSLEYKITPDINTYVSWALGYQPATFNAILYTQPASVVAQVQQQTGAGETVKGEQIDMYELGVKGKFLNNKLALNTDVYYGEWTNQVIQQRVNVLNNFGTGTATVLTVSTNLGKTRLDGWELDANANLTDKLTARVTFAFNQAIIQQYNCAACGLNITGNTNVTGHQLPQTPEESGSAFLEYRDSLGANSEWYANTLFTYSGKFYTDETNLAWSIPRATFDFRAGLDFGKNVNVELYCTNCFNDYYYDIAVRDVNFNTQVGGNAFNNVFYVNPPDKRRLGLRFRYKFG